MRYFDFNFLSKSSKIKSVIQECSHLITIKERINKRKEDGMKKNEVPCKSQPVYDEMQFSISVPIIMT